MSVPHTPTSMVLTSAWPGPGSGAGTSSTLPLPACPGVTTTARMAVTLRPDEPPARVHSGALSCGRVMDGDVHPAGGPEDVPVTPLDPASEARSEPQFE